MGSSAVADNAPSLLKADSCGDVLKSLGSLVLSDLPVRRYRLIYYKHVDGTDEHYLAIPVKRKKVSGQLESTVLVDLEANSVYVVKIQAMLAVGRGKRLKGRWNILYLRTPSMVKVTSKGTRRESSIQSTLPFALSFLANFRNIPPKKCISERLKIYLVSCVEERPWWSIQSPNKME